MPTCPICGEVLKEGARACSVCGSSLPEISVPTADVVAPPAASPAPLRQENLPAGSKLCPACGQVFGADYADSFCTCGVELVEVAQAAPEPVPGPPRPTPGTPCLILYGPDRQPVHYFPLDRDAVLIGRLDAVEGVFPDIDVTQWLDESLARKVSRKHALVLRSRAYQRFVVRPLAGNTGTQIEADMVLPLHDYPLEPGRRLILGGAVRLKFDLA